MLHQGPLGSPTPRSLRTDLQADLHLLCVPTPLSSTPSSRHRTRGPSRPSPGPPQPQRRTTGPSFRLPSTRPSLSVFQSTPFPFVVRLPGWPAVGGSHGYRSWTTVLSPPPDSPLPETERDPTRRRGGPVRCVGERGCAGPTRGGTVESRTEPPPWVPSGGRGIRGTCVPRTRVGRRDPLGVRSGTRRRGLRV